MKPGESFKGARLFLSASFLLLVAACAFMFPSASMAQKKPKQGGGQQHVFSGPAPEHPFDIILARPTSNSITISVMSAPLILTERARKGSGSISAKSLPANVTGPPGVSPPYAIANPIDQKARAPPALSSKFHRRTFATFFSRIDPARMYFTPKVWHACITPALRMPLWTALPMPPARRTALIARM